MKGDIQPRTADFDHTHKYFMFQIKSSFELLDIPGYSNVYEMKEYAYSACNCGKSRKVIVESTE